jgi:integrase
LLLRQAGLPDKRFHDLRHTCATLLLTKGIHPKIVSEMLRHSSIAITLDTYSHVIPGLGEVAASAMEDALR